MHESPGMNYKSDFIDEMLSNRYTYEDTIQYMIGKIRENLTKFTYKFPSPTSELLTYMPINNRGYATGFWTGILWLAYEFSGYEGFLKTAEIQIDSFNERIDKNIDTDTINLGSLYCLSCVAAYKITGNLKARDIALKAAGNLSERFREKGSFILPHGAVKYEESCSSFIEVSSLLNLSLLYWAAEETGNKKYYEVAKNHLEQVINYNIRQDGSTFQIYHIDYKTGAPMYGKNIFGYTNKSCWSRGQALAIYGVVLSYIYIGDTKLLYLAKKLANYFISRLPEDGICYWDLFFIEGPEARDTSAAAIAADALLEISRYLPTMDEDRYLYERIAVKILNELTNNYTTIREEYSDSNGILTGAVLSKPFAYGVDECVLIGDYFYFEALLKACRCLRLYW